MTDLINWDEPIETVDGERCYLRGAPNLLHGKPTSYPVELRVDRLCVYSLDGTPRSPPEYGFPRIRNVAKPKPASKTDDDELIDRLIAERDVASVRITELLIRVRDLERVNQRLRERAT